MNDEMSTGNMIAAGKFSGNHLRAKRKAARISRDTLAFCVGRTTQTIGNYERGFTRPSADVLIEIARYLECPVEDLFEAVDE